MNISAKSKYAVRALVELAERTEARPEQPRSADRRRRQRATSRCSFSSSSSPSLRRAGIVRSRRGASGGFVFARPPSEVTVLEVVEALDGLLSPGRRVPRASANASTAAARPPSGSRPRQALEDVLRPHHHRRLADVSAACAARGHVLHLGGAPRPRRETHEDRRRHHGAHRRHAARPPRALSESRGATHRRQARVLQPGRQRQGPHRPGHDRRRRARRRDRARAHDDRRAHQRQHRHRPRHGGGGARLPARAHHARDVERRASQPAARLRRRARAHARARRHARRHRARPASSPPTTPTASCRSSSRTPPTPRSTARRRPRRSGADTDGAVDLFVAGVGTGGTVTGVGQVLKERKPACQRRRGRAGRIGRCSRAASPGPHQIQGIGAGFVPAVLDTEVYDEVVQVPDDKAFETSRALAARRGHPRRHLGRRQRLRRLRARRPPREPRQAGRHHLLRHRRTVSVDAVVRRSGARPVMTGG